MILQPLPFDLVCEILSHLPTVGNGPDEYYAAQGALRACCLVSKDFYEVARPLLWRVVRVDSQDQLKNVEANLEQDNSLGRATRGLVAVEPARVSTAVVLRLLGQLAEVTEFVLEDDGVENSLDGLKSLHHLSLSGHRFSSEPPLFPHLVSFSLPNVRIEWGTLATLLSPSTTPALRALHLGTFCNLRNRPYFPNLTPINLTRLDMLQLTSDFIGVCVLPADIPSSRILYVFRLDDRRKVPRVGTDTVHHLQLVYPRESGTSDGYVGVWVTQLWNRSVCIGALADHLSLLSGLSTLYLPPNLAPGRTLVGVENSLHQDLKRSVERLLKACEKQGVEVQRRWREVERINGELWEDELG
ncbi:hypothetical protein JCM8547_002656 [Rhodosporidiobolus lusitaniae]